MNLDRLVITDGMWELLEPHCLGKASDPGRTGSDGRLFMEAVLWIARTGSPWRDLPEPFGKWNMRWLMGPLSKSIVIVRAQKGASRLGYRQVQRRFDNQDPRVDGCPWQSGAFRTFADHRHDTVGIPPLIDGINFGGLLADKAFDSNWLIEDLNERGAMICISQRPQRKQQLSVDLEVYKWRHLIENFFCKLKEFKRIAMRSDKTDQTFSAMIYLTAAIINAR